MAVPRNIVLIVEDEPLIRFSLVSEFEDEGFHVLEAGNVLEAVAILSRQPIDAIVTDVDMPGGLSGLDLIDLVSAVSTAAIVVVSGRALPSVYALPPKAIFLSKPYGCDQVVARVRRQIEQGGIAPECLLRVERRSN